MDILDCALKFGLEKLSCSDLNIRQNQKHVIDAYTKGKDVFFCSPTGSGKSLTFEIAPFVFKFLQKSEKSVIIVVSPLSSLMRSQVNSLQKRGIKATYLKDLLLQSSVEEGVENITLSDIRDGEIDIIFASPESILGHQRDLILQLSSKKYIKAIFVDEAHCIKK